MNTPTPFHSSPAADAAVDHAITHEAIARRARELWIEQGCPKNCDEAIWLEAEAELRAIREKRYRHPRLRLAGADDC